MEDYADLSFDIFKSELKTADTTRRLNVIKDNLDITPAYEWLSDSNEYGENEIKEFLEWKRTIISSFTNDSQGIYICAVRRLIGHYWLNGQFVIDSALSGKTYRDTITTVYNEPMIAIAVETITDSSEKYNVIPSNNIDFTVAHEFGHAFNLEHCVSAGCIMNTKVPWNIYYTSFCSD